jgi:BirA family biotin operon repressor/biotin-[acetyl-CoA-carboxylase] ligase
VTPGAPAWRLEIYDSLGSTSDLCRERAARGEPPGLAIMARRQERGRGSHGRAWSSPPGNLYVSVLLRPGGPAAEGGLWSLLAAVALAEAVEPLLPDHAALRLKWPNDLLLNSRKLAGILLDSAAEAGALGALVIGFGLNLAAAPALADREAAALAEVAVPPAPERVAAALLDRLGHWCGRQATEGFGPVREAWLARAPEPGTPMKLRQGSRDVGGTFAGLGPDGALLLDTGGIRHAFAAGEIRLLAGA